MLEEITEQYPEIEKETIRMRKQVLSVEASHVALQTIIGNENGSVQIWDVDL